MLHILFVLIIFPSRKTVFQSLFWRKPILYPFMFFFIVEDLFVCPLSIANHIFSPFSSINLIFPPSLNSPLVISVNSVPAFASNGMSSLCFSVFKIFFPVTIISPVPDNAFTGRFEESSIIIVFPDAFFIIAGGFISYIFL